jgi:glycosyltransferase involved in cell wall biosynthesis
MTISVLALAWYARDGASSRVRMMQYVPHLERLGAHVAVQSLLPAEYVSRLYREGQRSVATVATASVRRLAEIARRRDVDVIWLQREAIPYLPFPAERALLGTRKLIVDYDDAHHLYYKRSTNPIVRGLLGGKLERLMAAADAVTVGSQAMADVAQGAGARRVALVPSAVDTTAVRPGSGGPFTVGWIGSPMTAAESLPLVAAPLKRFLAETGARCLLVGVQPDQFPDLPAERIAWSEAAEAAALARMSVGLCPLPDTPWHRGKSGYKIIQYMAAGIPTLTAPVGIAADLVRPGETGAHCSSSDDWYHRLVALHGDSALRARQGAKAREIAVANYDTAKVAEAIFSTLRECRGP